jgi:hypothetical protein
VAKRLSAAQLELFSVSRGEDSRDWFEEDWSGDEEYGREDV